MSDLNLSLLNFSQCTMFIESIPFCGAVEQVIKQPIFLIVHLKPMQFFCERSHYFKIAAVWNTLLQRINRQQLLSSEDVLQSFPYKNHCERYKQRIKILACAIYTYLFLSFTNTRLLLQNKKLWSLFSQPIRSQTTIQLYILLDYFRVRVCFNINNKRHTLPILYTTLNFNHCCFTKIKQSTW